MRLVLVCACLAMTVSAQNRDAVVGAQFAKEIRRMHPVFDDESVKAYVRALGTRIAKAGTYTFEVLDSKSDQPISLLGGYIFATTSLLLKAQDEAELAGILAHAIAHLEARHGSIKATNPGSIPLIYTGNHMPNGILVPMAFQKQAHEWELEADKRGAQLAASAGYDPSGLTRYLSRAAKPDPARLTALQAVIDSLPQRDYSIDSSSFVNAQNQIIKQKQANKRPAPTLYR